MSYTTLETFYSDYRIQNDQQPNETVLNRGLMRLKREIRELRSELQMIRGDDLDEWAYSRIYEKDEYVSYNGQYFKSLVDNNSGNTPKVSSFFWSIIDNRTIADLDEKTSVLKSWTGYSNEGQTSFIVDFALDNKPAVFVNGILLSPDIYEYTSNSISLGVGLHEGDFVSIITDVAYNTAIYLPKQEFTAEQDDYAFETTFDLVQPTVFVNGRLLAFNEYEFTRREVILNKNLNEGDTVFVSNGSFTGVSFYTLDESDALFNQRYTKDETYNKVELDDYFRKKADFDYSEQTYCKIINYYTAKEIDVLFDNYWTKPLMSELLDKKANWGTTLADYHISNAMTDVETREYVDSTLNAYFYDGEFKAYLDTKADKMSTLFGYGIEDAYTKDEVDAIIKNFSDTLDIDNRIFDRMTGVLGDVYHLNAEFIDGLNSRQFLRSDIKTTNTGGIVVQDDDHNITLDVSRRDDIFFNVKIENGVPDSGVRLKAMSELNSNGLIVTCDGMFNGEWVENIQNLGFLNWEEYNWVVDVFPLITGSDYDFVPEGFGSDYEFTGFKTDTPQTQYHYGFVVNNELKLLSYSKINGEFVPTPAYYRLTGYHYSISHKRTVNQGEIGEMFIHNGYLPEEITDFAYREIDNIANENSLLATNVLEFLDDKVDFATSMHKATATHKKYNPLVGKTNVKRIMNSDTIQVAFVGGVAFAPVTWTIEGVGEISYSDAKFDKDGIAIAHIKGTFPYEGSIIVHGFSDNNFEGTIKLSVYQNFENDPKNTFVFDEMVFDHSVFTSLITTGNN